MVKASGARRPASSRARSAALGSRTKMGGCIPARCDLGRLAQGLAWVCTRAAPPPDPAAGLKTHAAAVVGLLQARAPDAEVQAALDRAEADGLDPLAPADGDARGRAGPQGGRMKSAASIRAG